MSPLRVRDSFTPCWGLASSQHHVQRNHNKEPKTVWFARIQVILRLFTAQHNRVLKSAIPGGSKYPEPI